MSLTPSGYADTFARESAVSPYNAHYDRPTILGILGVLTSISFAFVAVLRHMRGREALLLAGAASKGE